MYMFFSLEVGQRDKEHLHPVVERVLGVPLFVPVAALTGTSGTRTISVRFRNRNGMIGPQGRPTLCLPGRSYPQGWTRWRLTTWQAPETASEAWSGEGLASVSPFPVGGYWPDPFKGLG